MEAKIPNYNQTINASGMGSFQRKTHTITKEFLMDIQLEDNNVKIPYIYFEKKSKKFLFRYEKKEKNIKINKFIRINKHNRISELINLIEENYSILATMGVFDNMTVVELEEAVEAMRQK